MKTNLWKLSCMALAMTAITTGCTQNEELGTSAPSSDGDVLNVVATANDFVSSDPTSRVSETNYTTTFEEGDAIGVFVVRDGEAVVSNMKMTLDADGTTWAGENGAQLYYYKGADYIAYSPYTEGLSVTSEAEIVNYFTKNLESTTGQSTLAEYQKADLMTASVAAANVTRGQNIIFNFAHQMSMIEIKVPIRAYTTTGGYEYSAPLGLKVTMAEASATGKEFSLCTFGKETVEGVTKGIYRCIVAPSETTLNVEGEFQDGSVPVYFPATGGTVLSVTPEAGKYKGIDVNYTYQNYTATRDLKVGDYYYADGSICPGDMENIPSNGCVGVIFSTETSTTDANLGWSHGYVVALNNTGTSNIKWKNVATADDGYDVFDIDATDKTSKDNSFQALIDHLDGYTSSKKITDNSNEATHPAFFAAKNYAVSIPETTSGWYLPSMGQLALVMNNLGVTDESKKFTAQNCSEDSSNPKFDQNGEDAPAAIERMNDIFKKVGGCLRSEMDITESGWNLRWWGCGQTSFTADDEAPVSNPENSYAWCIDMNYGTDNNGLFAKYLFLSRTKTDTTDYDRVRPVFAF